MWHVACIHWQTTANYCVDCLFVSLVAISLKCPGVFGSEILLFPLFANQNLARFPRLRGPTAEKACLLTSVFLCISRQLQAVKRFKELFDIEALAKTLCNEAMARLARSRNVKMQMAITCNHNFSQFVHTWSWHRWTALMRRPPTTRCLGSLWSGPIRRWRFLTLTLSVPRHARTRLKDKYRIISNHI